jgi:hypothetical protein
MQCLTETVGGEMLGRCFGSRKVSFLVGEGAGGWGFGAGGIRHSGGMLLRQWLGVFAPVGILIKLIYS